MIGAESQPKAPIKVSAVGQLNGRFNGRINDHFNVNYTLTSERIPNLIAPAKVDLLGRNSADVLVRTIDTTAGADKITNDVATFYMLKDAYRKNTMPVKDFIMASEPLKKFKKQHDIWQHISQSGDFTYIDFSEADKLKKFAEENHVKPVVPTGMSEDDERMPFHMTQF